MLDVNKQSRIQLKEINLNHVFGSSVYFKSLNLPALFGPSNDENLKLIRICLESLKK